MADPNLLVPVFTLGWAAGIGTALLVLHRSVRRQRPGGLPYDWRTRYNHENHNAPQGPPPLLYRPRSSGSGEPNPPPREP